MIDVIVVGSGPGGTNVAARLVEAGRSVLMLDFVRRRPWSVGSLDGAAALLDPGGLLRSKVLVMSALLEATPGHADDFLPCSVSAPALLWRLASSGTVAVLQAAVGALLYRLVGRARA